MDKLNFDEIKKRRDKYNKKVDKISSTFTTITILIIIFILFKFTNNIRQFIMFSGIITILSVIILAPLTKLIITNRIQTHSRKKLNDIAHKFQENKNSKQFYDNLLNIKIEIKDPFTEWVWVFNYTTALYKMGLVNESIIILKKLNKITYDKENKNLIATQIRDIENMKKSA